MANKRPRVFISYSHSDGMTFVRRLVEFLSPMVDLFWDRKLRAGDFEEQLEREIESCDYFLYVMTERSLKSDYCIWEVNCAEKNNTAIVLAYLQNGVITDKLQNKYTFGDFRSSFDVGFRRITALMLGRPHSPWDIYSRRNDDDLFSAIQEGSIPGSILLQICEQIISELLWSMPNDYAKQIGLSGYAQPRTAIGTYSALSLLLQLFTQSNDVIGAKLCMDIQELIEPVLETLKEADEEDHAMFGDLTSDLISATRTFIVEHASGTMDITLFKFVQSGSLTFEIAENIRSLIRFNAQRVKYHF